jgi:hypothetical protein
VTFHVGRYILGNPTKQRGSCWLKDDVPKRADWHLNEGTISGVLRK